MSTRYTRRKLSSSLSLVFATQPIWGNKKAEQTPLKSKSQECQYSCSAQCEQSTKKPRLRSWQKTQKPRKYVCVYLCAPVCVCESVYVRVTVCVQPAFGFEPFCCTTTKSITSYIPTWCYPPLNKIQSTLRFYVKYLYFISMLILCYITLILSK